MKDQSPVIVYVNKVHMDDPLPAVNFTLFNSIGLAQAGAQTHLFIQVYREFPDGKGWLRKFGFHKKIPLTIHQIPDRRFFGIKSNQWFYIRSFFTIRSIHRKTPVTAVISRDPGALPYLSRLRKKTQIPVFYQPHNFYLDLTLQPEINPKNAKKYHRLESGWLKYLNGILCLQEAQASWYRKYLPDVPVVASKPGLMHYRFDETDRFSSPLIGYSGSLQMKKGMKTLLLAINELKQSGLNIPVVLIGGRNQDEIDAVEQEIRDLNLSNTVTITGWLPYPEVEKWLRKITVGILPLTNEFYNQYLTAPNKLFDYLSAGIPIIASNLPSIRDFLISDPPGILFEPDNPSDLANAIRTIISDRNLYNSFVAKAQILAVHYQWKNQGKVMIDHINNLIKS